MTDRFSGRETAFMRRALELGARGEGRTSPNPPVGCVVVKNGAIIAEGWHERLGGLHAEAMALAALPPGAARGATAYVTLAPCATRGRQPPCVDALAAAGIAEVVVAARDANPQNAFGPERLGERGIPCRCGLLEAEAEYLARGFFSRHRRGRPFLTLKYAMTLDGRTAAVSGDSRWISSPESRELVQDMRSRADAVMVGIGTAVADDPLLTVREPVLSRRTAESGLGAHPQPLRVVVDGRCRLPSSAAMLGKGGAPGGRVLLATLEDGTSPRAAILAAAGAEILRLPAGGDGKVCLAALLAELGRRGVNAVLCEGGSRLAAGLVAEDALDEAVVFLAPKMVGGPEGPAPVAGIGVEGMAGAKTFTIRETRRVGPDIMVRAGVSESEEIKRRFV